ncbi:MAG: NADH-quinone oxidoreductase subunit C, partial [Solirubrobacteraceae bacterium]
EIARVADPIGNGDLAREVQAIGGRLMMLFAFGEAGTPELCAIVASPEGVVRLRAEATGGSYPSLTPTISGAHWFEREIHDLYGIVPEGHPRLEPLVRHEPDRGELSIPEPDDVVPEHRGARRLSGPGVFVIPYGPVRSGVFESVQYLVQTGGEDVAYCAQRLFFKRRGAERRICEVPLELAVLVAERVSGTSSVAHALAFSHAVESLSGTEVPARGQAIRRVLAELERLYNHLEVTVRECEDASLAVAQAQFAALKERLHRLAGEVVGNRFLRGAIVPGGVRVDFGPDYVSLVRDTLRDWERDFRRTLATLLRTDSFLDRLVSAGPLSERDAIDFGCVGPVARGSAVETDARREFPYDGYSGVAVAVHTDGDAMARMEVRFQEIDTSLVLIAAALDDLPAGATRNAVGEFVSDCALGAAESARGETLYWLEAGGPDAIGFCKLRAASFVNYGIFNRVFDSQVLTDFSFVEHSLGLSPAGCDA